MMVICICTPSPVQLVVGLVFQARWPVLASVFNRLAVPVHKKPPKAGILVVFCQREREEWGRSLHSCLTVQMMFPATSRQFCPNCIWARVSGDARAVEAKEAQLARAPSMWIWEMTLHCGCLGVTHVTSHPCSEGSAINSLDLQYKL